MAHDANEELDGTTTDSPVVTGSGFNSSDLWDLHYPIFSGLSSPISPLGVMHDDVDATLSPHDFLYDDNAIPSDDC